MSFSDKDLVDFRLPAVEASEGLQRNLENGLSLERSGCSYCLERRPSLVGLRMPLKVIALISAILGILGVGIGGMIGLLIQVHELIDNPKLVATALSCSVGGMLVMGFPSFVQRRILYRRSPRYEGDAVGCSEPCGIHVSLENPATCDRMKLLAEDVGLIYVDPHAATVKIECLSYEYLIQGKDVVALSLHANGKSVLLSYRIGAVQLDLVIVPRSLLAELKRQIAGSSRNLFDKLCETLGPEHTKV